MLRWYVARTKPHQEAVAIEHLQRQEFECYFPQIRIERIARSGRIAVKREPLFPGYMLIRFVLADHAWRTINSTRGIISLLQFGENNSPSPMPIGEVENIKERESKGKLFISEVKRIRTGDTVKLKFGHCADQIGKVVFTRGERIELLLSLLGRQTRIKAPVHLVEVVQPKSSV